MTRPSGVLDRQAILDLLAASPPLIEEAIDLETQVQPNGVDLTLRDVARYAAPGVIDFSNTRRALAEVERLEFGGHDRLHLDPGPYLVTFNEVVNLPLTLTAMGRTRSSLLRSGAALHTAVWDAGYSGRSRSLLVVYHPRGMTVYRNARIMQMVFLWLQSPATEGYRGAYLGENS